LSIYLIIYLSVYLSTYTYYFISQTMTSISRYFSNHELYELFQLDNTRESKTQQQLEQMHAHQRVTDTALDEHIAYLYSCGEYINMMLKYV